MNAIKSLTGKKFGKLVVVELSKRKGKRGELYWDCLCDCGTKKTASGDNLKAGKVKSCGCLLHEERANKQNLIGRRFGRLLVIAEVAKKGASPRWKCQCDCGNGTEIDSSGLRKQTKSCGCLRNELASARRKVNQLGPKNACWNPQLTDEDRVSRRFVKGYKEWSFRVKQRANFTCIACGDKRGGNLISHHLYSYMKYRELRLDDANGVCICEKCHGLFHDTYGWGDNTKEQFMEWLNDRICAG